MYDVHQYMSYYEHLVIIHFAAKSVMFPQIVIIKIDASRINTSISLIIFLQIVISKYLKLFSEINSKTVLFLALFIRAHMQSLG